MLYLRDCFLVFAAVAAVAAIAAVAAVAAVKASIRGGCGGFLGPRSAPFGR